MIVLPKTISTFPHRLPFSCLERARISVGTSNNCRRKLTICKAPRTLLTQSPLDYGHTAAPLEQPGAPCQEPCLRSSLRLPHRQLLARSHNAWGSCATVAEGSDDSISEGREDASRASRTGTGILRDFLRMISSHDKGPTALGSCSFGRDEKRGIVRMGKQAELHLGVFIVYTRRICYLEFKLNQ